MITPAVIILGLLATLPLGSPETGFQYLPDARVTEYLPWRGDRMNCYPPCDMTAYMIPVEYGVTAACNGLPFDTEITFWTPWGEVVTRWCQDYCPGCAPWPDGLHIDVAMPEDDNGRYYSPRLGGWPAVVRLLTQPPAPRETILSARSNHEHEID